MENHDLVNADWNLCYSECIMQTNVWRIVKKKKKKHKKLARHVLRLKIFVQYRGK